MIRPVHWKRVLAVPAALSLALGGALLASAPAGAAPQVPSAAEVSPSSPGETSAEMQQLVVTSPRSGATLDSRRVEITGTAPVGARVLATVEDFSSPDTVDEDGLFGIWLAVPPAFGSDITVVVTATAMDGSVIEPVELQLTLPAPLAPPVITSPTNGQRVVGNRVTFSGTGVPGEDISLYFYSAQVPPEIFPQRQLGRIIVDSSGRWSFSSSARPDTYVAVAEHVEYADSDESGGGGLIARSSLPSNVVEFSVVAAPGGDQLAATGGADGDVLAAAAATVMVLGGAALVVLRRKRGLVG